jgi:lipopolysaccharide export system protein LptA
MTTFKLPKILKKSSFGLTLALPLAFLSVLTPIKLQTATAQTAGQGKPLQIRSDVQEYDAKTKVVTARGNVQMLYSARGIQATAAQAQYFSNEQQIVLTGNVYILQQGGNSIRGERVTYLIDQGRFIAQPQSGRQVESIYLINDASNNQANTEAPKTPTLKRRN